MKNFVDLAVHNHIFPVVIFILIIVTLVCISLVIDLYFRDIFRIVLIVYMIYFPVGAFMGVRYWINTKDIYSQNIDTLAFLYCTIFNVILLLDKYLVNLSEKKNKYQRNIFTARRQYNRFFDIEEKKDTLKFLSFCSLYITFFAGVYTWISFFVFIFKYIKG